MIVLVSFCVSFIRIRCISLTSCLATMHRYPVNRTMLCSPLSFNLGQCHLSTTKCELCWTLLWRSRVLCRDLAVLASLHSSSKEGFIKLSQVVLFSVCVCSPALFVYWDPFQISQIRFWCISVCMEQAVFA